MVHNYCTLIYLYITMIYIYEIFSNNGNIMNPDSRHTLLKIYLKKENSDKNIFFNISTTNVYIPNLIPILSNLYLAKGHFIN